MSFLETNGTIKGSRRHSSAGKRGNVVEKNPTISADSGDLLLAVGHEDPAQPVKRKAALQRQKGLDTPEIVKAEKGREADTAVPGEKDDDTTMVTAAGKDKKNSKKEDSKGKALTDSSAKFAANVLWIEVDGIGRLAGVYVPPVGSSNHDPPFAEILSALSAGVRAAGK